MKNKVAYIINAILLGLIHIHASGSRFRVYYLVASLYTDSFDIDMSTQTDGIFGYYVLTATASGTDTATDRVQFEYRALRLEDPSKKEENTGNPYVDVHYNIRKRESPGDLYTLTNIAK